MTSAIFSGEWRATYSRKASRNSRLRDFRVRRAKRSTASRSSWGMKTTVFILKV